MNNYKQRTLALAALAVIGIGGAASYNRYSELRATRTEALAAWQAIGAIHAERERAANATLGVPAKIVTLTPGDVEHARAMLSQARAMPADPALLDDPRAIDTYKRYQGELTGSLFVLAYGARTPAGAAVLAGLRDALPRYEAALAQARLRYRHAARRHNANAASLPGTLVGTLTGQGPIPPEL